MSVTETETERQFIVKQDVYLHRENGPEYEDEAGQPMGIWPVEAVFRASGTVVPESDIAKTVLAAYDEGDKHALSILEEASGTKLERHQELLEEARAADVLPWDGYDELGAKAIVAHLDDATGEEILAKVEAYENDRADGARSTVLKRVEQIREGREG